MIVYLVLGGASGVKEQVARHPPHSKHHHDLEQVPQGRVEKDLLPRTLIVVRLGRGCEHLVILARAGVTVVLAVADTPGVVGHKEGRVKHPT